MERYYVNQRQQTNGDHEVHKATCQYLPANRTDLGYHGGCWSAVVEARRTYPTANGCYYCSNVCHTT